MKNGESIDVLLQAEQFSRKCLNQLQLMVPLLLQIVPNGEIVEDVVAIDDAIENLHNLMGKLAVKGAEEFLPLSLQIHGSLNVLTLVTKNWLKSFPLLSVPPNAISIAERAIKTTSQINMLIGEVLRQTSPYQNVPGQLIRHPSSLQTIQ